MVQCANQSHLIFSFELLGSGCYSEDVAEIKLPAMGLIKPMRVGFIV